MVLRWAPRIDLILDHVLANKAVAARRQFLVAKMEARSRLVRNSVVTPDAAGIFSRD